MPDLDGRQTEMDRVLRRSLAAPVPRLSPDFQERLSREVRRRTSPPHPFGPILLIGYGAVAASTSIVVMRGQGLSWGTIAAMTLGSLATLELARRLRPGQWRWQPGGPRSA